MLSLPVCPDGRSLRFPPQGSTEVIVYTPQTRLFHYLGRFKTNLYMLFGEELKSWWSKFQQFKVGYKDGFYQLSNLANSPYTISESLGSMPFTKHSREKRLLTASTFFLKTYLYYAEVEEGLWIFVSELDVKRNIVFHNIFDESVPVKFNLLNIHYTETEVKDKSFLLEGRMLTDKMWSVVKAGSHRAIYHFKGILQLNITVFFTNEWFAKQSNIQAHFRNSNLEKFLHSDNNILQFSDTKLDNKQFYDESLRLMKENIGDARNKEIKEFIGELFKDFIKKYDQEGIGDDHFKLSDSDRKCIQKAEQYLLKHTRQSFPGIEEIAKNAGVSPTKLKKDFKTAHGQSLYKYYRHQQMLIARELLTQKQHTVKEVAALLGYENASKFSEAFKEHIGELPSALLKNNASS